MTPRKHKLKNLFSVLLMIREAGFKVPEEIIKPLYEKAMQKIIV